LHGCSVCVSQETCDRKWRGLPKLVGSIAGSVCGWMFVRDYSRSRTRWLLNQPRKICVLSLCRLEFELFQSPGEPGHISRTRFLKWKNIMSQVFYKWMNHHGDCWASINGDDWFLMAREIDDLDIGLVLHPDAEGLSISCETRLLVRKFDMIETEIEKMVSAIPG